MKEKTKDFLQLLFIILVNTLIIMAGAPITPIVQEMKNVFSYIPNIDLVAELVLTIKSLAVAVGAIIIGFVIDRFGRKKVLVLSTFLNAVFGTVGFYVNNLYIILVSRIFLGFTVAGVMTSITALIGDFYFDEKRHQVLGIRTTFTSFGGALFTVLGGALGDISWNYAFLVYFISLIILPGVIFFIPEPELKSNDEKEQVVEFDVTKVDESQGFPIKVATIAYLVILISMIAFYFIVTQLSSYFPQFGIESELIIGLALSISGITSGIASLCYKYIRKIIGIQMLFIITLVAMGGGFILLAFAPRYWVIFISVAIFGIGWGFFMPNIQAWLLLHTPTKFRGRAVGIFILMLFLGQFLSPFVANPIKGPSVNISRLFLVGGIITLLLLVFPVALMIIEYLQDKDKKSDVIQQNPE
jgi:MFS family permease